jgi:hypothetical protein
MVSLSTWKGLLRSTNSALAQRARLATITNAMKLFVLIKITFRELTNRIARHPLSAFIVVILSQMAGSGAIMLTGASHHRLRAERLKRA